MVKPLAYQAVGFVDIDLEPDDYHYMFLQSLDDQHIVAQSSRSFEVDQSYTILFSLPVLDWIFKAQATVNVCEPDAQSKDLYWIKLHFELDQKEDQKKLETFFDMYKKGQTSIEDFSI